MHEFDQSKTKSAFDDLELGIYLSKVPTYLATYLFTRGDPLLCTYHLSLTYVPLTYLPMYLPSTTHLLLTTYLLVGLHV